MGGPGSPGGIPATIPRAKWVQEKCVKVAHLVDLIRLELDPEDSDGEGGAKDASLWPLARVPNLEVLGDAVGLDPGNHDMERGVVVVEEALGVDLHDGPKLLEGGLDPLQKSIIEMATNQGWSRTKRLVDSSPRSIVSLTPS